MADRREGSGGPGRHVLLERVPGDLECVPDRERGLLDAPDDGEELAGRLQPGGSGMAPGWVDGLPADEPLEQISGRSTALRSQPRLFAEVRLGGLGRDGVDRVDRRAGEREAGCSGQPQARGLFGARVPNREQRDAVGADEGLEADALVHPPGSELAQETKVFAPHGCALRKRPREQLGGRCRAGVEIVDQLRRGVCVAGNLVERPLGDRLPDLGVPPGERLSYAAHCALVIAPA